MRNIRWRIFILTYQVLTRQGTILDGGIMCLSIFWKPTTNDKKFNENLLAWWRRVGRSDWMNKCLYVMRLKSLWWHHLRWNIHFRPDFEDKLLIFQLFRNNAQEWCNKYPNCSFWPISKRISILKCLRRRLHKLLSKYEYNLPMSAEI